MTALYRSHISLAELTFSLLFQNMVPKDSLMLKRTSAFMQRNSSWVTFSMQNLWESSFILTQCSYILDTCIRSLRGGKNGRKKNCVRGGRRSPRYNKRRSEKPREGQARRNTERWKTINGGRRESEEKREKQQRWEKMSEMDNGKREWQSGREKWGSAIRAGVSITMQVRSSPIEWQRSNADGMSILLMLRKIPPCESCSKGPVAQQHLHSTLKTIYWQEFL